jgi:hypothetical protein
MEELPVHCVSPGLHVPWHDAVPPSTEHAEPLHATAVPHVPMAVHVSTPCAEHWVAPGTHWPSHAPLTHAEFAHATGELQAPLAPHVSTPLFEHRVAPGVQTPAHAPLTHA